MWWFAGIWLLGTLTVFANLFPVIEDRPALAILISFAWPLLAAAAAVIALSVLLWERWGLFNAGGTPGRR